MVFAMASDPTRRLTIDLQRVAYAMEDHSDWWTWILDLETGELLQLFEDEDLEEDAELREAIDDPDRYADVPTIESREVYDLMCRFAEDVEDDRLGELLAVALDGKGAFGRFKRVLSGYPEEREAWFRMRDSVVESQVRDWLASLGIDPVDKYSRSGPEPSGTEE